MTGLPHSGDPDVQGYGMSPDAWSSSNMSANATAAIPPPLDPPRSGLQTVRALLAASVEVVAAVLVVLEIAILLASVTARYVFNHPLFWTDELASLLFLWLVMLGGVLALMRDEHLKLTIFVRRAPPRTQAWMKATATVFVVCFLAVVLLPAKEYIVDEWPITTPTLGLSGSIRTLALGVGFVLMLVAALINLAESASARQIAAGVAIVAVVIAAMWILTPFWRHIGNYNLLFFCLALVLGCMLIGVPIVFCFGIATVACLFFTTSVPMTVVINRMDEGMSGILLVSVPVFILLGCILDASGMGKALVDFLASLLGHLKGGLAYVLLGSMYLVSGISGSKVADMATVAPALFPEMKRRGQSESEMIALLASGAVMAETVPPSIIMIAVSAATGVSIAGLFSGGFTVALVLALSLAILARIRAGKIETTRVKRTPLRIAMKLFGIALPAIALPFIIRGAVVEGVATPTEVSTFGVLYALVFGGLLYGGIHWRKLGPMLVETATLTGSVVMILGTAGGMAWALTQTGFATELSAAMQALPGGAFTFMLVSIAAFIILGCFLEGLPAIVLLGPLMFPIAKAFGINDVHYALTVIVAMSIGLFLPPLGIGYYIACTIGRVSPETALRSIWPYMAALLVGLLIVAALPQISIGFR